MAKIGIKMNIGKVSISTEEELDDYSEIELKALIQMMANALVWKFREINVKKRGL